MRSAILLISATLAFAQQTEPPKATFEEQPAFVLANGAIELTVFLKGSTFANLVLADDAEKLSPWWNPARLARESGQPKDFGDAFGHFICVDGFGPVSPEEQADTQLVAMAQATVCRHISPRRTQHDADAGRASASHAGKLHADVARKARMWHVESQLESLAGFDRPAFWPSTQYRLTISRARRHGGGHAGAAPRRGP
jgi:hypothetical protein